MHVTYTEPALERLDAEVGFTAGYPPAVASAFRGRMQVIRAAPREEAMLPLRSLRMERYGKGNGQHSLRIIDGWQLIVAFKDGKDGRTAVVEAMIEREGNEESS
jgi:plasmid maintenance system killer protein